MKTRSILIPLACLLPLVVVLVLALIGITFEVWTYVLLGVVCPAVAATVWFLSRETEKEISKADEKSKQVT